MYKNCNERSNVEKKADSNNSFSHPHCCSKAFEGKDVLDLMQFCSDHGKKHRGYILRAE